MAMGNTKISSKTILLIAALLCVVVPMVLFVRGYLHWHAQSQHNQAGEDLAALKTDVTEYAQDHNDHLPPMSNYRAFQQAVFLYAKSTDAFHQTFNSSIMLLPNPNLSGKRMSTIRKSTVFLYESRPSSVDNSRWVAFLPEGVVATPFHDPDFRDLKLVKEDEWQKLRKSNGILE